MRKGSATSLNCDVLTVFEGIVESAVGEIGTIYSLQFKFAITC